VLQHRTLHRFFKHPFSFISKATPPKKKKKLVACLASLPRCNAEFRNADCQNVGSTLQGEQIGRFAHWAIVFFGQIC
jgi:hypothetical protein